MLFLFIDTASAKQTVALFKINKVNAEKPQKPLLAAKKTWTGKWDESIKVLPNILAILHKAKKSFNDLSGIFVLQGPGPFSSVRIGVTIANALSFALHVPTFGVTFGVKSFSAKSAIDIAKKMKESNGYAVPVYAKPPSITLRNF